MSLSELVAITPQQGHPQETAQNSIRPTKTPKMPQGTPQPVEGPQPAKTMAPESRIPQYQPKWKFWPKSTCKSILRDLSTTIPTNQKAKNPPPTAKHPKKNNPQAPANPIKPSIIHQKHPN